MTSKIVCFGELLLRFTAPGNERLLQSLSLDVHCGGAEANVAVSLSRFGHDAEMVSAVADNALGAAIVGALRAQGVGTSSIVSAPGRLGLYFLETGAVRRPSRIVYDRAGSVFAATAPGAYNWQKLLSGADLLHVSGITPAVGAEAAAAALAAVKAASQLGVTVSFDGNYREALWKSWNGDGPAVLRDILAQSSIAFINERDIALLLGTDVRSRAEAVAQAFDTFDKLECVAATIRQQDSVSSQTLTGDLFTRTGHWQSRAHDLPDVVDRIGAGDAFAAGLLHARLTGMSEQDSIEFAMAAGAIKHSILGDWNLTSVDEVMDAMNDDGLDVRR